MMKLFKKTCCLTPSADDIDEEPILESCFCPITREIMQDPVTAGDLFVYERAAIKKWVAMQSSNL